MNFVEITEFPVLDSISFLTCYATILPVLATPMFYSDQQGFIVLLPCLFKITFSTVYFI